MGIRCRIVRDLLLRSLQRERLDEEHRVPRGRVRGEEGVQRRDEGLEGRHVVGLDAGAVYIVHGVLGTGRVPGRGAEEGIVGQVLPGDGGGDVVHGWIGVHQGLDDLPALVLGAGVDDVDG